MTDTHTRVAKKRTRALGANCLLPAFTRHPARHAARLVRICNKLDVKTPNLDDVRPGVAKLADETSLDWMRRYHLDAATPS